MQSQSQLCLLKAFGENLIAVTCDWQPLSYGSFVVTGKNNTVLIVQIDYPIGRREKVNGFGNVEFVCLQGKKTDGLHGLCVDKFS